MLFLIIGAAVAILGTGGFAAWWKFGRATAPAEGAAEAATEKKEAASGIVGFEPFIVNLADTEARRFLRISVRLIVDDEEAAEHITKSEVTMTRLRSDILEQLTQQTAAQVASAEGKTALKKSIAEHAKKIVEPTEVADVLFSDFVVQY